MDTLLVNIRKKVDKAHNVRSDRGKKGEQINSLKYTRGEGMLHLKTVFIGDTNIGTKSSFIDRYATNRFPDRPKPTIGPRHIEKSVVTRGRNVKVHLWDTSGQKRYLSLEPMFFRGADGIVVGYDVTNRSTLETARKRYAFLKREYPDAVIMVLGNKLDLENDKWHGRLILREEGEELARDIGASLFFEGKKKSLLLKFF